MDARHVSDEKKVLNFIIEKISSEIKLNPSAVFTNSKHKDDLILLVSSIYQYVGFSINLGDYFSEKNLQSSDPVSLPLIQLDVLPNPTQFKIVLKKLLAITTENSTNKLQDIKDILAKEYSLAIKQTIMWEVGQWLLAFRSAFNAFYSECLLEIEKDSPVENCILRLEETFYKLLGIELAVGEIEIAALHTGFNTFQSQPLKIQIQQIRGFIPHFTECIPSFKDYPDFSDNLQMLFSKIQLLLEQLEYLNLSKHSSRKVQTTMAALPSEMLEASQAAKNRNVLLKIVTRNIESSNKPPQK